MRLCPDEHALLSRLQRSVRPSHSVFIAEVGGTVASDSRRKEEEDDSKKDEMDDDIMFTSLGQDDKSKPSVAPRWVTRVFAADCLCRIIHLCENADKAHFDLAAARVAKTKNPEGKHLWVSMY